MTSENNLIDARRSLVEADDDAVEAMAGRVDAVREQAAAQQAERDRQDAERRAEYDRTAHDDLVDQLRGAWLEVPGNDEASFRDALPRLLREYSVDRTLDRLGQRRSFFSPLERRRLVNGT